MITNVLSILKVYLLTIFKFCCFYKYLFDNFFSLIQPIFPPFAAEPEILNILAVFSKPFLIFLKYPFNVVSNPSSAKLTWISERFRNFS